MANTFDVWALDAATFDTLIEALAQQNMAESIAASYSTMDVRVPIDVRRLPPEVRDPAVASAVMGHVFALVQAVIEGSSERDALSVAPRYRTEAARRTGVVRAKLVNEAKRHDLLFRVGARNNILERMTTSMDSRLDDKTLRPLFYTGILGLLLTDALAVGNPPRWCVVQLTAGQLRQCVTDLTELLKKLESANASLGGGQNPDAKSKSKED